MPPPTMISHHWRPPRGSSCGTAKGATRGDVALTEVPRTDDEPVVRHREGFDTEVVDQTAALDVVEEVDVASFLEAEGDPQAVGVLGRDAAAVGAGHRAGELLPEGCELVGLELLEPMLTEIFSSR